MQWKELHSIGLAKEYKVPFHQTSQTLNFQGKSYWSWIDKQNNKLWDLQSTSYCQYYHPQAPQFKAPSFEELLVNMPQHLKYNKEHYSLLYFNYKVFYVNVNSSLRNMEYLVEWLETDLHIAESLAQVYLQMRELGIKNFK